MASALMLPTMETAEARVGESARAVGVAITTVQVGWWAGLPVSVLTAVFGV